MSENKVLKVGKPAATSPKKPEGKKTEAQKNSPPRPLLETPENLPEIHVDPELRDLLPRLSEGVYATLEQKLLKQKGGVQVTVKQDGVILDGHHGYEISIKHDLPFSVKVLDIRNKEEAKQWMRENQLARRNLTKFQSIEYALELEGEIVTHAKSNQKAGGGAVPEKSPKAVDTREEVAKLADTSSNTVSKVKYILEHADDETKEKLRKGEAGMSINKVHSEIKARNKPETSKPAPNNPRVNKAVESQMKQDDPSKNESALSENPQTPDVAGNNDSACENRIEVPNPPQAPVASKGARSKASIPQAESGGAEVLFAYVQEELQKLPYEEQEEFWDMIQKAYYQGTEKPKQDVLDAPKEDNEG